MERILPVGDHGPLTRSKEWLLYVKAWCFFDSTLTEFARPPPWRGNQSGLVSARARDLYKQLVNRKKQPLLFGSHTE